MNTLFNFLICDRLFVSQGRQYSYKKWKGQKTDGLLLRKDNWTEIITNSSKHSTRWT